MPPIKSLPSDQIEIDSAIGQAMQDSLKPRMMEKKPPIIFAEEKDELVSSEMEQGKRVYQTRHHGRLVGELGGLCQDKNTATILAAVEELQKAGYITVTKGFKGRMPCTTCAVTAEGSAAFAEYVDALADYIGRKQ